MDTTKEVSIIEEEGRVAAKGSTNPSAMTTASLPSQVNALEQEASATPNITDAPTASNVSPPEPTGNTCTPQSAQGVSFDGTQEGSTPGDRLPGCRIPQVPVADRVENTKRNTAYADRPSQAPRENLPTEARRSEHPADRMYALQGSRSNEDRGYSDSYRSQYTGYGIHNSREQYKPPVGDFNNRGDMFYAHGYGQSGGSSMPSSSILASSSEDGDQRRSSGFQHHGRSGRYNPGEDSDWYSRRESDSYHGSMSNNPGPGELHDGNMGSRPRESPVYAYAPPPQFDYPPPEFDYRPRADDYSSRTSGHTYEELRRNDRLQRVQNPGSLVPFARMRTDQDLPVGGAQLSEGNSISSGRRDVKQNTAIHSEPTRIAGQSSIASGTQDNAEQGDPFGPTVASIPGPSRTQDGVVQSSQIGSSGTGYVSSGTPNDGIHDTWEPNYMHTSKCDRCDENCKDVQQRCLKCSKQFCRKCIENGKFDRPRHGYPAAGFDWTVPEKIKTSAKKRKAPASQWGSTRKRPNVRANAAEDDEDDEEADRTLVSPTVSRPRVPNFSRSVQMGSSRDHNDGFRNAPSYSRSFRPGNSQATGRRNQANLPIPSAEELDLERARTFDDVIDVLEKAARVPWNARDEQNFRDLSVDTYNDNPSLERLRAEGNEDKLNSLFKSASLIMRVQMVKNKAERGNF